MEWVVNPIEINDGDVVFFTENDIHRVVNYGNNNIKKIGWLLESPAIINQNIVFQYIDYFDEIYTCREDFLNISQKFKFLPVWCTWIKVEDRKIYEKSKMVSIIASYKRQTNGHMLRHSVISNFNDNVDIFGSGYNVISDKIIGLKDYRFSIVIENTKQNFYFTEKLIDCFQTGTVPIYWGCPSINKFFNEKGMLVFDNGDELFEILNNLTIEKYIEMFPFVEENFKIANGYKTAEDYLKNYNMF